MLKLGLFVKWIDVEKGDYRISGIYTSTLASEVIEKELPIGGMTKLLELIGSEFYDKRKTIDLENRGHRREVVAMVYNEVSTTNVSYYTSYKQKKEPHCNVSFYPNNKVAFKINYWSCSPTYFPLSNQKQFMLHHFPILDREDEIESGLYTDYFAYWDTNNTDYGKIVWPKNKKFTTIDNPDWILEDINWPNYDVSIHSVRSVLEKIRLGEENDARLVSEWKKKQPRLDTLLLEYSIKSSTYFMLVDNDRVLSDSHEVIVPAGPGTVAAYRGYTVYDWKHGLGTPETLLSSLSKEYLGWYIHSIVDKGAGEIGDVKYDDIKQIHISKNLPETPPIEELRKK